MLSVAILFDILFPDPQIIWHPIALIGRWIAFLEKKTRRLFGNTLTAGFFLALLSIVVSTGTVFALLTAVKANDYLYIALSAVFLYFLLCGATLRRSGERVQKALKKGDLNEARARLQEIVGRDTSTLDEEDIIRGVLETLSENTIDGLVSPLLFIFAGMFFGQPVVMGVLYKTINTLDSMVAYRNERFRNIGYFSAKFDDLANFFPSRIGAGLMILCGGLIKMDMKSAWRIMWRDARTHISPNSGWPEAAVAGLLGVRLGGDAIYFGQTVKKASLGDDLRPPKPDDIRKLNRLIIVLESFFLLLSLALMKGLR
jgi:adenosylcobinamide-phosphate synthase